MTVTFDHIIEQVLAKSAGATRPQVTFTRGDVDAEVGQVPMQRPPNGAALSPGVIVEVDTEMMYILDVDSTSGVPTVVRGWGETEPTLHTDQSVVRINPRFPRHEVVSEFWVECSASYPNIGRPHTSRVWPAPGDRTVNLSFGDYDGEVPELDSVKTGTIPIPGAVVGDLLAIRSTNVFGNHNVRGQIRQSTWFGPDLGSGTPYAQLALAEPASGGGPMDVTVMVPYDAGIVPETVAPDDDIADLLGASRSGLNALVLGTVFRLMQTRVVQRTDLGHQNESRIHDEVTVGDLATVIDRLRIIRDRARSEAALQLRALYPWRVSQ